MVHGKHLSYTSATYVIVANIKTKEIQFETIACSVLTVHVFCMYTVRGTVVTVYCLLGDNWHALWYEFVWLLLRDPDILGKGIRYTSIT